MEMESLTKTQLVLLVLLVSFVTSFVTGIVTVTLIDQAPSQVTDTIHKIVERVKDIPSETRPLDSDNNNNNFVVITQDDLVIKLVKDASPAVVSVVATKDVPVIERFYTNPFFEDPSLEGLIPKEFYEQFQVPQYRQKGTEQVKTSAGTGFFVSEDGMLITNKHVVEDTDAKYTIIMNDGRKFAAEVLAKDPFQDIAVLKVEGKGFPFVSLGNSNNINVGQTVVAIGNALGEFQNTISVGVISGLGRTIVAYGAVSGPERLQEVIQTDAAINPGNSGGPLLDLSGRAIGINTAVAAGAENIGFALPINFVKKAVSDVNDFGEIKYAYLGVSYITLNPDIAREKNLKVDYGAFIIVSESHPAVMPGSPAEQAGIKEGDIILEMAGVVISPDRILSDIISQKRVNDEVELRILRGEENVIIKVKLAERPKSL